MKYIIRKICVRVFFMFVMLFLQVDDVHSNVMNNDNEKIILEYDNLIQKQKDTLLSWKIWYFILNNEKLKNNCLTRYISYNNIKPRGYIYVSSNVKISVDSVNDFLASTDRLFKYDQNCASEKIFFLYNIDRIFHQKPVEATMCNVDCVLVGHDSIPVFDFVVDNYKLIDRKKIPKEMLDSTDNFSIRLSEFSSGEKVITKTNNANVSDSATLTYRSTHVSCRLNNYQYKNLYYRSRNNTESIIFSHYNQWIAMLKVHGLDYLIKNNYGPIPKGFKWISIDDYEKKYRYYRRK